MTNDEMNRITNAEIEMAAELFEGEGWTEMAAELWAAVADESPEGRGNLARLVSHYRAHAA